MSVESWKSFCDWAAVGLVGLTFIVGAGALITGRILNDRQSSRLALAEQHAAEANAKAEKYKADIAKSNETAEVAKAESAKANLELARLTGPPYLIPVIHGVATPDLSKSSKQLVILTGDTLIKFPTLPEGKSLAWTLVLTQDGVGQHQFKTLPKVTPENVLFNPPHSSWVLTLQTDSHGTIATNLGGATYIAPPDNSAR